MVEDKSNRFSLSYESDLCWDTDSLKDAPLVSALRQAIAHPTAPFHTPGHKRGQGIPAPLRSLLGAAIQADLPELPEFGNLAAPDAALLAAQILAAETFGAEQTYFLVNGTTCGLEAAVLATCNPGDKLILPRNAHRAAIAALIFSGAVPIFVEPVYDATWGIAHSMTATALAETLAQHPEAKAVMMLYPTYYGVCGEIEAIAQLTHQYDIPLLVDEAHAAHFAFHPDLPISALAAGADLTVQSTHKVLSALTQASTLHVQGNRIDRTRLQKALQLVQSTSPSYLLLASLDAARWQMATQGEALLTQTLALADEAIDRLAKIPSLKILRPELRPGAIAFDRTRLTVDVRAIGLTGFEADERLHGELGVTAELPGLQHLMFMVTLGNTSEDIDRLVNGLSTLAANAEGLDRRLSDPRLLELSGHLPTSPYPPISPRAAFFAESETVAIAQAVDRISAELVCPYPPGIPVLFPGEVVTVEAIEYLQAVMAAGGVITGCGDSRLARLDVLKL